MRFIARILSIFLLNNSIAMAALTHDACDTSLFGQTTVFKDAPTTQNEKPSPPLGNRGQVQKRSIRLYNELDVLLVSDPGAQESAASMDIPVGFLDDPAEHRGLAHFLEHMLFQGTEKYPDVSEYNRYIRTNGGHANAYTSLRSTNYHLAVNTSAFPEALDRFANFFLAPRFAQQDIEKELRNIDSEYTKNLDQAYSQRTIAQAAIYRPNSGYARVFQGNKETLGKVTRDIMLAHYLAHYSANTMKLAVVSPLSLDEQEALVRARFSQVPNRHLSLPERPIQPLLPHALPAEFQVQSKNSDKLLTMWFPLPSTGLDWSKGAEKFIVALFSHTHKGSLSQLLKDQGLATYIAANADQNPDLSGLTVYVSLTDRGTEQYRYITRMILSYFEFLQRQPWRGPALQDIVRQRRIGYDFGSPWRGDDGAVRYASLMGEFNPLDIEEQVLLAPQPNIPELRRFLTYLNSQNMLLTLQTPKAKTNQKTHLFDASYAQISLKDVLWTQPLSDPPPFRLPAKNPYLPSSFEGLGHPDEIPQKVLTTEQGEVWRHTDPRWADSRAGLYIQVLTSPHRTTAHDTILQRFFEEAVTLQSNELFAAAFEAGMTLEPVSSIRGFNFRITGFSQRLARFTQDAMTFVSRLQVNEREFAHLREAILADIAKRNHRDAYQQAYSTASKFELRGHNLVERYGDEVKTVTVDELNAYIRSYMSRSFIRLLSYGSVDDSLSRDLLPIIAQTLHTKPLPEAERPRAQILNTDDGPNSRIWASNPGHDNAWYQQLSLGLYTPEKEVAIRLLEALIGTPFYHEMRTERGLGYVVQSFRSIDYKASLAFLIQSQTDPLEIQTLVRKWTRDFAASLEQLPDIEFAQIKAAVLEDIMKAPTSFREAFGEFTRTTTFFEDYPDAQEQMREALNQMSRGEFIARASDLLLKTHTLEVCIAGKKCKTTPMPGDIPISEIDNIRATLPNHDL